MKGERLIPVKAESELRVGMIVVCRRPYSGDGPLRMRCGHAAHRFMLLKVLGGSEYEAEPKPACLRGRVYVVSAAIAEGRLFRVDDGLDEQADEHQAKHDARRAKRYAGFCTKLDAKLAAGGDE